MRDSASRIWAASSGAGAGLLQHQRDFERFLSPL